MPGLRLKRDIQWGTWSLEEVWVGEEIARASAWLQAFIYPGKTASDNVMKNAAN